VDLLVPFELVVRESCGPQREAGFKNGHTRRSPAAANLTPARKASGKQKLRAT
jgi:hypothetical protein